MPPRSLLISNRVKWLLTSPTRVKSRRPRRKTLHRHHGRRRRCWHTRPGQIVTSIFFLMWREKGKKKNTQWKKLLDSELIWNWRQFKRRHYLWAAAQQPSVAAEITSACRHPITTAFMSLSHVWPLHPPPSGEKVMCKLQLVNMKISIIWTMLKYWSLDLWLAS